MKEISFILLMMTMWVLSGFVMEKQIRDSILNKERANFAFHKDLKVKVVGTYTTEEKLQYP